MLEIQQDNRRYFIGIRKEGDFIPLRWLGENEGLSFLSGIPYSKKNRKEAEEQARELEQHLGDCIRKLADRLIPA